MSSPHPHRERSGPRCRRGGTRLVGILLATGLPFAAASLAGCGDSGVLGLPEPGRTRPLVFECFLFHGSVWPMTPSPVRAGVLVGPSPCWKIERAGFEQRADTLFLTGTASTGRFDQG